MLLLLKKMGILVSNKKVWVAITSYFLVFAFFLAVILFVDIIIQKFIIESEKERNLIISNRQIEDFKYRESVRKQGYRSLIYPALFEAHLNYIAKLHKAYPLGGVPNQKTYYCNEGYGLVKYTSDRYGFRNDDSIYKSKIDVMLVGDSFVQGACVENQSTISSQLKLHGLNAINMGMAADNPLHYAARAKVFTKIIRPRYLVINFYINDNLDFLYNQHYWEFYFRDGYKNEKDFLNLTSLHSVYMDALEYERKWYSESSKAELNTNVAGAVVSLDFKIQTIRKILGLLYANITYTLPPMSKLAIDEASEQCLKNNCIPLISYIPASSFFDADYNEKKFIEGLRAYSEHKNILFVDCSRYIGKEDRENYAPKGPHLSELGYRKAAQCIAEGIK